MLKARSRISVVNNIHMIKSNSKHSIKSLPMGSARLVFALGFVIVAMSIVTCGLHVTGFLSVTGSQVNSIIVNNGIFTSMTGAVIAVFAMMAIYSPAPVRIFNQLILGINWGKRW